MNSSMKQGCLGCAIVACVWIALVVSLSIIVSTMYLAQPAPLHSSEDAADEVIAPDGISQGFPITEDFVQADTYTYQVGLFAETNFIGPDQPALQIVLDYPVAQPLADPADTGSLWLGTVLDNNYFIQIGMMTGNTTKADGTMDWNYFWEMWDEHDVYQYGLMEPMSLHGWDQSAQNTFRMKCIDPTSGEWHFLVNDVVVGKTFTDNCKLHLNNTHVFWELTTTKTDKAQLPTFGPFVLPTFFYDDGTTWQAMKSASLSYSYGRIIDGSVVDQAQVCPPYGAEAVEPLLLRVGSGVPCTPVGTKLFDYTATN